EKAQVLLVVEAERGVAGDSEARPPRGAHGSRRWMGQGLRRRPFRCRHFLRIRGRGFDGRDLDESIEVEARSCPLEGMFADGRSRRVLVDGDEAEMPLGDLELTVALHGADDEAA